MCVRPRKEEKGDFSDRNADRVVIEFDSLQVGNLYILNLNMLFIKVVWPCSPFYACISLLFIKPELIAKSGAIDVNQRFFGY